MSLILKMAPIARKMIRRVTGIDIVIIELLVASLSRSSKSPSTYHRISVNMK